MDIPIHVIVIVQDPFLNFSQDNLEPSRQEVVHEEQTIPPRKPMSLRKSTRERTIMALVAHFELESSYECKKTCLNDNINETIFMVQLKNLCFKRFKGFGLQT